jgi:polyhydroxybutyrate depolymerase
VSKLIMDVEGHWLASRIVQGTSSNVIRRRRGRDVAIAVVLILTITTLATGGRALVGSAVALPGCGPGSPGSTTLSLVVDGFTRTVIVHVPRNSTNASPLALVLNLHGSASTASAQEVMTNMDVTADANNFIVAYPQALVPFRTGFEWNVPGYPLASGVPVPANAPNDVQFLTELVGLLEGRYCVNSSTVYATGYSGGAREVSQLACTSSSVFAAVAPVDGLRRPSPCPTKRAVPVIAFHGTADQVNPFGGSGQPYWTYSVSAAAKMWAQQDYCSARAKVTKPVPTVKLVSYSRCSGSTVVRLYEVIGEGHQWPGGPPVPPSVIAELGPQSNAISANSLMWSFFKAHPLR